MTTAAFNSGGVEDDGWERVPSRAIAIRMYAQDLGGALCSSSPPSSSDGAAPATYPTPPSTTMDFDEDIGTAPSTQLVVRQAAARHTTSRHTEPLSILMGSYQTAPNEPRYSYESILAWVPPQWIPDSCAPACKSCCLPFTPVVRLRHHCRLCGLIFCHNCSTQKLLLPPKCAAATLRACRSAAPHDHAACPCFVLVYIPYLVQALGMTRFMQGSDARGCYVSQAFFVETRKSLRSVSHVMLTDFLRCWRTCGELCACTTNAHLPNPCIHLACCNFLLMRSFTRVCFSRVASVARPVNHFCRSGSATETHSESVTAALRCSSLPTCRTP
jgi:hypothetical protein